MLKFEEIIAARERLREYLPITPLKKSPYISSVLDIEVYFKYENFQITGSFKERGALNKLLSLSEKEKKKGVITASAGNHGQGLAYHSTALKIPSTIVMPESTPLIKVDAIMKWGAEVVLHGANFQEAYEKSLSLKEKSDLSYIHPFDDHLIMAGQGTVALEIYEQNPEIDIVVVPIGGGGLAAGLSVALKKLKPEIKIIGVQSQAVPGMRASFLAGKIQEVKANPTIADGISVSKVGAKTFNEIYRYVDDVVTVNENEIARAILALMEREKTVVEGSGAVGLASLIAGKVQTENKKVCSILSGGNIDMNVISRVIERGLVGVGRVVYINIVAEDKPGTLANISKILGQEKSNILEIFHTRGHTSEFGMANIGLRIETRGWEHLKRIKKVLKREKYIVKLSDQLK